MDVLLCLNIEKPISWHIYDGGEYKSGHAGYFFR